MWKEELVVYVLGSVFVICILYWIGQASDLINKQTVLFSVTVHIHLICCVMSIIELSVVKLLFLIELTRTPQPVLSVSESSQCVRVSTLW